MSEDLKDWISDLNSTLRECLVHHGIEVPYKTARGGLWYVRPSEEKSYITLRIQVYSQPAKVFRISQTGSPSSHYARREISDNCTSGHGELSFLFSEKDEVFDFIAKHLIKPILEFPNYLEKRWCHPSELGGPWGSYLWTSEAAQVYDEHITKDRARQEASRRRIGATRQADTSRV